MLGNWFATGRVDEFADAIVAELRDRFPPTEDGKRTKGSAKKTFKGIGKIHRAIFARIEEFARSQELSLYRKARLGNRVKWALTEAGYPKPFVDAFVHEILTVLALAPKQAAKASGD